MKWIKTRDKFLNEAKIKDVLLPRQRKVVASAWSEKYLEYEEVEPTDNIFQGKWKLTEEDKIKVLSNFFGRDDEPVNMELVFKTFENLPERFVNTLKESVDPEVLVDKFKIILDNFNPNKPTIDQITIIYESIFRKLNVNETKASEFIKKDENGRPIRDEEGNMVKVEKEKGAPIFEKNLVNIKAFIDAYNRCYDETIDSNIFYSRDISNLISLSRDNHDSNLKIDFKIFDRDMYLSINHNAQHILNMSVSTFFSSCQHLYSGGYRSRLLGNVFDPNSIPAFLVFDTPIFWDDDKISDFLPLCRMIIRNIEEYNNEDDKSQAKIFFDRSYPDRMQSVLREMVEKYSGNKENVTGRATYIFTPDIDLEDRLSTPYMDRLGLEQRPFIGVNTKSLFINRNYNWSNVKISKNAKIKEIVIETNDIPPDLLKINLKPDWIKFKFIKINDLSNFKSIITDSLAFDKCKISTNVINDWPSSSEIKKLQIISCDVDGTIKLSNLTNLEELHLIYTLDNIEELKTVLEDLQSIKKLVISGDLMTKSTKKYFNELKQKGIKIKVETVGPVI